MDKRISNVKNIIDRQNKSQSKLHKLLKIYWLVSDKALSFNKWLIKEDYLHMKWFITTLIFVFINIIGWVITYYYKCK